MTVDIEGTLDDRKMERASRRLLHFHLRPADCNSDPGRRLDAIDSLGTHSDKVFVKCHIWH
jgi:hypothetical protein